MYKMYFFFMIFLSVGLSQSNLQSLEQIARSQGLDISRIKGLVGSGGSQATQSPNSTIKGTISSGKKDITSTPSVLDEVVVNSKESIGINENTKNLIEDKISDDIKEEFKNLKIKDEYFGYSIFKNNPEIFQRSSNVSVDSDYSVGPGDEIIIMLWGETEIYETYYIAKDGYLFIPNVGRIFVNGLNLDNLEKKLFNILKKVYSSLDNSNGNAKTFFDVSLGASSFRPIKVFVLGDVNAPGAYNINQSSTLFSSVFYFGGPNISGSLRDIQLIRNNKNIATIDFYDYLRTGKQINDIKIQRDDIIFIPPRKSKITTIGEIEKEMIFELKENEGLKELISISGGIKTSTHLDRIRIDRVIPPELRKPKKPSKTSIDVNLADVLSDKRKVDLYDGDEITFFKIDEKYTGVVNIEGSVKRPGRYELSKEMTVRKLIENADGLLGDAFTERAELIRTNEDLSKSIIQINLSDVMNNWENDVHLKSNDVLKIFNNTDMKYKAGVSIVGHVKNPGLKQFYSGMKLIDLIMLGGGFDDRKHLDNTYFDRADLIFNNTSGNSTKIVSFNLDSVLAKRDVAFTPLEMGCRVKIYSYNEVYGMPPKSVKVSGYVKRPGVYDIVEDLKVLDLLFLVGGFEDKTFMKKMYLDRFDLIRPKKDSFLKYKSSYNLFKLLSTENTENNFFIEPGDEIIIYSKENFISIPKIEIKGEINSPGVYDLKEDMTLIDLLVEAGGVSEENQKFKVDISSFNRNFDPFNSKSNIFEFRSFSFDNVIDLMNPNFYKNFDRDDISLKNRDVIIVRADPYKKINKFVSIVGDVKYPGQYPIVSKNDKVSDIIERAGGFLETAYPVASTFIRNGQQIKIDYSSIVRNSRTKYNFNVEDGDVIEIGKKTNIIEIKGEVNNPGLYQYVKGFRYNDYIKLAGGYTKNASKYESFVVYPDGSARKNKLLTFKSPKIKDSSVINVKSKEKDFSTIELLTVFTETYSSFVSQYLMILLLTDRVNQS